MEKKIRVVGTKFSYYNGFIMHYNIAIGISCFMADSCVCSILMPSILAAEAFAGFATLVV